MRGVFAFAVAACLGAAKADTPPSLTAGHAWECAKDASEGPWVTPSTHYCHETAVPEYLAPAMDAENAGARIYLLPVPLPKLTASRPEPGLRGVAALASAFRDVPRVKVSESNGVIRVRIGEVPHDLLDTRVLHLAIDRGDRYDFRTATMAIEGNAMVFRAMDALGYSTPLAYADFIYGLPDRRRPHIPATIDDLSLDRALDMAAATFKGIHVYGYAACGTAHIVRTDSFYSPEADP